MPVWRNRVWLALAAAGALMSVACDGSKEGERGESVPDGVPVANGAPMIVYRSTISGDLIAEATDHSRVYKIDLGIDLAEEAFTDLACAPGGGAMAYSVSNGQTGETRISFVGGGPMSAVELPFRVVGMAWSPDGNRIAVTGFPVGGGSTYRLMMVSVDAGTVEGVLSGDGSIGPPRWSPDGTSLVFELGSGGPNQVYMIRLGDAAPARFTNRQQGAFAPEWHPDGQGIVFAGPGMDSVSQIYSVPLPGGDAIPLTSSPVSKTLPRFSPDGARLAFVGTQAIPIASVLPMRLHNLGVWIAAADGTGEELFTDIAQDAWLVGWCAAGSWLDEVGGG